MHAVYNVYCIANYPQNIPERFTSSLPLCCTNSDTLLQNAGSFEHGHLSGLCNNIYSSSARFSSSLHGTHTFDAEDGLWDSSPELFCVAIVAKALCSQEILLVGVSPFGDDLGLFSPIFL